MSTSMQQYLDFMFTSPENFEKVVFEIKSDSERNEVLEIIAKQIVTESDSKSKINFKHIPTLNALDLSGYAFSVVKFLLDEAVEWLAQYFPDENAIRAAIQEDKMKVFMIHNMGMDYFFENKTIFLSEVAESYFELLQEAESFRHISKLGHEVINGTTKIRSLFLLDDGAKIVRRADQVWMRVDQASKAKKRKIFSLTNDLSKHKEAVEDLQMRISAIKQSGQITAQMLKKYTPELVRDIFTEDDPKYIKDRRILSVLPAGPLCFAMETLCERAAIAAKTMMARDEYRKIQAMFAKGKINNTPNELNMKRLDYEHKLPFKAEHYKEVSDRFQKIQDEPLENFDEQLFKIRNAIIANLEKFPVNK